MHIIRQLKCFFSLSACQPVVWDSKNQNMKLSLPIIEFNGLKRKDFIKELERKEPTLKKKHWRVHNTNFEMFRKLRFFHGNSLVC